MQLTNEQVLNADAALQMLGAMELPQLLALKVARMRGVLMPLARSLNEVREADNERRADRADDGERPRVRTDPESGRLVYVIPPDAQFDLRKQWEETLRASVDVVVQTLAASEFPGKLRGQEFAIAPNIYVGLGPLFTE